MCKIFVWCDNISMLHICIEISLYRNGRIFMFRGILMILPSCCVVEGKNQINNNNNVEMFKKLKTNVHIT